MALAALAEKRDNETGNHLRRTRAYVELLIERLRAHPAFAAELATPEQRERIAKSAPLHDIGKVGIPDSILLKPGRLSDEEREVMKTHPALGAAAIRDAIRRAEPAGAAASTPEREATEASLAFLETAARLIESHHEKWDGSGYPLGLAGEAIPVPGRLMALADVFDALITRRPYKEPIPLPTAVAMIREQRGRHFDPAVVDAFVELVDDFAAVMRRFDDAAVPAGDGGAA